MPQPSLDAQDQIIVPRGPWTSAADRESLTVWGFEDSFFRFNPNGEIEFAGPRYPLSQHPLPHLLPWIERVIGIPLDRKPRTLNPAPIPEGRTNLKFFNHLVDDLKPDQIDRSPEARLRHGHGHTQDEMYRVKYGHLDRIPDLVIYPESERELENIVIWAARHNVCLIPFGGGTSVTEALQCPKNEDRMVVSVDMKRMDHILSIDPVNHTARIQAGAVGRNIVEVLARHGFTMGHEPDSIEFSTLGGWIATHASGMKKNKYGNIEDLVLDFRAVTIDGVLSRSACGPRESVGPDPRLCFFGSEGELGIITEATVKIFPLPEVQRYGSIVFPSFSDGVHFMYALSQIQPLPASVRLVDNLQFQFSQALKPAKHGFEAFLSRLQKGYVLHVKGFDPQEMVACTLVFEGHPQEVQRQEQTVYRLAKGFRGIKAGAENGERGYQLTFSIAYIRDFMMAHHVLGESFETSVPWGQVLPLCENVKRRVVEEHCQRGLPGRPFISCRVTQIYETGVCVYFYLGFSDKGLAQPNEIYREIEEAAREEILKSGGSLSHHHGIGKIRRRFLKDIASEAYLAWLSRIKQALDPQNIFGSGNTGPDLLGELEHETHPSAK